ncbi:MAG: thiamine-phosphate kinase [Promethearchaeota archaeon]|jgi:thiamine-monophosphate kinase
MNNNPQIRTLGEIKLIKLIEDLVLKKTSKALVNDDSFFFNLKEKNLNVDLVINSDMLVSSTDVPPHMNTYQIGKKSVVMNVSDLLVKGVRPRGIIISLGLPPELKREDFIKLIEGIIDCSLRFDLDYIGGDINETNEIIISPTVFGFRNPSEIIHRKGMKIGDILVINNRFGLTGVGFDILINKHGNIEDSPKYKRSLMSVLEPDVSGKESLILAEEKLATSSIDSSDGLSKTLFDLRLSNPNLGFEIEFNDNLIDLEAVQYSQEFSVSLENLVFNGGEEFIHLFAISPKDFSKAKKIIQAKGGNIFSIGKVIAGDQIYIIKENKRSELKSDGFEHFIEKT